MTWTCHDCGKLKTDGGNHVCELPTITSTLIEKLKALDYLDPEFIDNHRYQMSDKMADKILSLIAKELLAEFKESPMVLKTEGELGIDRTMTEAYKAVYEQVTTLIKEKLQGGK